MGEQERFDNFVSKFMAYAAQAEITDDTMMRDDLFDKVMKPKTQPLQHLDSHSIYYNTI